MGKASIHIQKASGGAITHNSRENYSKSVVFKDEKNELWNDKKSAFQIYREELKNRVEAYTNIIIELIKSYKRQQLLIYPQL